MDDQLKAKWLEALRSGNYKQTTGVLKNDEGFCCLGVLCDIMDNSKWSGTLDPDGDAYFYMFSNGKEELTDINSKVKDSLGLLKTVTVSYEDNYASYQDTIGQVLIDKNDSIGASFEDIANYIEQNL